MVERSYERWLGRVASVLGVALAIGASPAAAAIFVDGFETATDCTWSRSTHPFEPPLHLVGSTGTTTGAPSAWLGTCGGAGAGEKVYAFTPPVSGTLKVSIQSSGGEDLALYLRDACTAGNELQCSNAGGPATTELVAQAVTAGATVYVFVDGATAGDVGGFDIYAGLCGDGIVQTPFELCDGLDLNGLSCATYGFGGGSLACDANCYPDLSNCTSGPTRD